MGAERLHLGRLFQRARHIAVPQSKAGKKAPRADSGHPPHIIKEIQDAEVETAKRIADGSAGADAKDKAELAEYFNDKLGRDEFTA
ncbi:MAG: hypothetical protein KTV68_08240 [Acidimicrobiia bacterium]|nr:hypothetical protein [Acidimicrobiia bacterium]